jgi:hypothetical protein
MFFGLLIFIGLAILCVVAFVAVKQRDRRYGRGEGLH